MSYLGTRPGNQVVTTVADGSITTAKVADNAITTAKIAPGAVIPLDMANGGREFGMRNRIINGAMMIDQRNAGASVTPANGQYTLDRWFFTLTQSSRLTSQRSTIAPTGFVNSNLITSSSAYSVLSGDTFIFRQFIEGFNVADLGWGTTNAQTVTLSFWVRSSLTGTFGGAICNGAGNRSYPYSYSISSANTWEQKFVTIAGDTTGTWATDNTSGLDVRFGLGSGSTFLGTSGVWAAGNLVQPTGTVSVVGTNGATFYITGVQLEVGSTATSFDYRPYGTELALCQRYFEILGTSTSTAAGIYGSNANAGYVAWFFKSTKRASPTVTFGSGSLITVDYLSVDAVNGFRNGYPYIANGSIASAEL